MLFVLSCSNTQSNAYYPRHEVQIPQIWGARKLISGLRFPLEEIKVQSLVNRGLLFTW